MSSTLGVSGGGGRVDDKYTIDFEETELRLGLGAPGKLLGGCGKRVFSESVDLKLNLSSTPHEDEPNVGRCSAEGKEKMKEKNSGRGGRDPVKPPAKAQVVGWPPVRSFRRNVMAVQPNKHEDAEKNSAAFVKVSMDGAPYLRKVDLRIYKSYQELSDALTKMFSSFTNGDCGSDGTKDFMNESKLIGLAGGSEYVPTYEDKDGDWMLVGDVPWEMFVESCKRLRITKGSEDIGHAEEKCKNRS
ncbi:hypothetical protein MLD38_023680 [Melastoma candidum]|uniref:Uncharacterized protein n=1 Tax=Melastoma candidum TaxID=119954 RepID=A0ACB9NQV8_9MYRT|nr:hypothetical protein MLD38_023680 [Melastoma candidum]